MVNWVEVQTKIFNATYTLRPNTIEEASYNHASIFVNDVLLKSNTLFGSIVGFVTDIETVINTIKSFFLLCFETNINSFVNLLSVPYITLSSSIVSYLFSTITLSNLPTPIATVIPQLPISNIILFPGEPISFGTLLYNSFNSGKLSNTFEEGSILLSNSLVSAYTTYLSTISGTYYALQPVPLPGVPVPIVIPWIGLF